MGVLLVTGCRLDYDPMYDEMSTVTVIEDRLAGPDTMTSVDELDEGTEGLSLREAIVIANNTPEKSLILFDRDLFKAGAGTELVIDSTLPQITGDFTTIDARNQEVNIVVADDATSQAFNIEANDIHIRGLNLLTTVSCSMPLIQIDGGERIRIEENSFKAPGNALIAHNAIELSLVNNTIVETTTGFTVGDSGGLYVRGNTLTDLTGRGMLITDTNNVRVHSNTMTQVAGDQIVVRDGSNINVEYNDVIINNKTSQKGVHFLRVTDSRICENFIDPGAARLIALEDSSDNLVEDNILDHGDAGVVITGASFDNLIFRNVIVGSVYDGIYVAAASTGNIIVHNTIHDSATPLALGDESALTLGNNLITEADFAGYVDTATFNYKLVDGSENVDAGEDLGFDVVPGSKKMYRGAGPDLGAVETR
jgi:nitrous oxidase accessory protein NosD